MRQRVVTIGPIELLVALLGVVVAACGNDAAPPATTLAPFVTAVTTTSTTEPLASTTTRAPVVTLPPDTTTSTTTTTVPPSTSSTSTTVGRAVALVLRDDGLGDALFGTDPEAVIDYVTAIVGRPTADSGWADPFQFGVCPGTEVRSVAWGDLTLMFSDKSVVLTGRRHFFTWTYGPAFGPAIDPGGMITDAGLGVGATVAQLRTAYPDIRINPADEILGPWFAISDEFTGLLTGTSDTDVVTAFTGGIPCGE